MDTQCVYYEEDVNGVTQVHTFYAVPKGEGALLVEVTGYVNLPLQIPGEAGGNDGNVRIVIIRKTVWMQSGTSVY